MVRKTLFGGAIEADFPNGLVDVSNFRQVPDNQEVFLHRDSNVSIVVEVLQRVAEPNDVEAIKFHFEALAHDNDATSSTIEPPVVVRSDRGDQPSLVILRGTQRIRKFNTVDADDVDVLVALFRINFRSKSADLVLSESIPGRSVGEKERATAVDEFNTLVLSLHIIDYDLFA